MDGEVDGDSICIDHEADLETTEISMDTRRLTARFKIIEANHDISYSNHRRCMIG